MSTADEAAVAVRAARGGTLFRRRTRNGAHLVTRFTAQVMNEVRLEQGALAACLAAYGLSGGKSVGWQPPEAPSYAWFEYCLEATGRLTRALRLLCGPPEVAALERAAAEGGFAASIPGAIGNLGGNWVVE